MMTEITGDPKPAKEVHWGHTSALDELRKLDDAAEWDRWPLSNYGKAVSAARQSVRARAHLLLPMAEAVESLLESVHLEFCAHLPNKECPHRPAVLAQLEEALKQR